MPRIAKAIGPLFPADLMTDNHSGMESLVQNDQSTVIVVKVATVLSETTVAFFQDQTGLPSVAFFLNLNSIREFTATRTPRMPQKSPS